MNFDKIDMSFLKENFDDEMISDIDIGNITKIVEYLKTNNVYYAKDLLLNSLDLFLLPANDFINKFEKLKNRLGKNFADKLEDDLSLFEYMYED